MVKFPDTISGAKVLVIEDDRNLLEALRYNLVAEGYDVSVANDGLDGLNIALEIQPHLIVLDLMLPTMGGIDVCRTLRQEGSTAAIIILTARDSEMDRVVGLEVGADDYVSKPFSVRELLARVSAQLRRNKMIMLENKESDSELIKVDDLEIDLLSRSARLGQNQLVLRPREFELLAFLAARPGRVFSREQVLQEVWGYDYLGDTRTVDVHIRWLRMKIEMNPSKPQKLQTVRGFGYRFVG